MKSVLYIFLLLGVSIMDIYAQEYSVYKTKIDTSFESIHLGYKKKLSITLPSDWQEDSEKKYPLIIVFDSQNRRSYNQIIRTVDYLSTGEQMPQSIIVGIESSNGLKRINEARSLQTNEKGKAHLTEKYLFEEVIPFVETNYKASKFRLLIGHSWFGHFTTSLFSSKIDSLNAVIALDPFFKAEDVSLSDSIVKLLATPIPHNKYFRFVIGKNYPSDYVEMNDVAKSNENSRINIKGVEFPSANHMIVPGLGISQALYDVFEYWSIQQYEYFKFNNTRVDILPDLKKNIEDHYGINFYFSLGNLNGKGWGFYNNGNYDKAILAWKELLVQYPNYSEGYLYIVDAQIQLKEDTSETINAFKENLKNSNYYSDLEKKELLIEFQNEYMRKE